MSAQADVSAFNLATAGAAWVGSLVIALVGALVTYRATVKAGREQAIETERMRLRHQLLMRRVIRVENAAERLIEESLEGAQGVSITALNAIVPILLGGALAGDRGEAAAKAIWDTLLPAEKDVPRSVDEVRKAVQGALDSGAGAEELIKQVEGIQSASAARITDRIIATTRLVALVYAQVEKEVGISLPLPRLLSALAEERDGSAQSK